MELLVSQIWGLWRAIVDQHYNLTHYGQHRVGYKDLILQSQHFIPLAKSMFASILTAYAARKYKCVY